MASTNSFLSVSVRERHSRLVTMCLHAPPPGFLFVLLPCQKLAIGGGDRGSGTKKGKRMNLITRLIQARVVMKR